MIFKSIKGFFTEKYFEDKINYFDSFKLVRYYFPRDNPKVGFFQTMYHTVISDLSKSEQDILQNFKKSTRYKIGRAIRENIVCSEEKNINVFFAFYNDFAQSKKIELLRYSTLLKYKNNMIITKAVYNNTILVMHVYIYDKEVAMLLYTASHFRNVEGSKEKNFISSANLLLHYEDMILLKKMGCKLYDFGGYAFKTKNKSLQGINNFKDMFNPEHKEEAIYTSLLLFVFLLVKKTASFMGLKMMKL